MPPPFVHDDLGGREVFVVPVTGLLESDSSIAFPKRFSSVFQTIIAIAPLLGLLGTILGLIRSFAAVRIGEIGANANTVTGGISEALVSTAAGMVVAIFALAVFNIFRAIYRRQMDLLQESTSQLEIVHEWHCQQTHQQENSLHARVQ